MTRIRERGKQRQGWMLRVAGPVGKETSSGQRHGLQGKSWQRKKGFDMILTCDWKGVSRQLNSCDDLQLIYRGSETAATEVLFTTFWWCKVLEQLKLSSD